MHQIDAVTFALGHIRVSSGVLPDRASFVAALASGEICPESRLALETHLYEASPAELASLVADGFTTFPLLARLAGQVLPAAHANRIWLESTTGEAR